MQQHANPLQNSCVSEHAQDSYQIKWNRKCSNKQAHILASHTLNPWGEVKTFFSESSHVAYQLKGMEHRTPCKHIVCPYTHPQLVSLTKR